MSIDFEDVCAAARAIEGAVVRTPVIPSRLLSDLSGAQIFLKMENLQYTASFKERGALVKLLSLGEQARRGVVAMSAGNHALGVAFHAQRLGIPATIVMPRGTPFIKVANTRFHGATVELHGDDLAEAAAHAHALAEISGAIFVHPYDDPRIIAGQGTLALEFLAQVPDLDVLVIHIGGGGLIAGCAVAAKHLRPQLRIVGVESERYASMRHAVAGGPPVIGGSTIAEGIAVSEPGILPRQIVERLVDDILTVSEASIEAAVQMLAEIEKTVVEGAGAAAVAAVFDRRDLFAGRRTGVVICGGNIDARLLASVLMRGLVRAGRLAGIRVSIGDRPGELAKVANLIGQLGGNIIEIAHQRLFHRLSVKMTELDVVVETRDDAHVREIVEGLHNLGFATRLTGDPLSGTEQADSPERASRG
ncbi:MAG: threonine ammonia-lyase [Rhodospirillales bacterium]|nr:threonine ammonia-lyase [Rhodospirillales bacterium]